MLKHLLIAISLLSLISCATQKQKAEIIEPTKLKSELYTYYYSEKNRKIQVYDYHGVLEDSNLPDCTVPLMCGDLVYFECVGYMLDLKLYYNNLNGKQIVNCGEPCIPGIVGHGQKCTRKCPPKKWACESPQKQPQ